MKIPDFIQQIPTHIQHAWGTVNGIQQGAKNWFDLQRNNFSNTTLWQNIKPLHERYIEPLSLTDYVLLGGSLTVALVITDVAFEFFVSALPVVMGFNALLICGTVYYTRSHLQSYFNKKAWDPVNNIRKAVYQMTYKDQKLKDIRQELNLLKNAKFAHLEELKQLESEIDKFQKIATAPYFEEKQAVVLITLKELTALVQGDPHDKGLLDTLALEVEINKIGTPNQDLIILETKKQKLRDLKMPLVHQKHSAEQLIEMINDLVKIAQAPRLLDSKAAFGSSLEELLKKLDRTRTPEALVAVGPLNIPQTQLP